MATGRELILDSLLEIGIGALGEDVEQSIINHCLRMVNRMLSILSADLGVVYASTLDTHTWPAGSASQTIGSSGDINTVRPIEITGFQVRVNSVDYTLQPISYEQYQTIPIKTLESNFPSVYAYQKGYPLGTLYIDFEPTSSVTARIQSKKALSALTLDGSISLPDGYEDFLQAELAVRLAPTYGKTAKPETVQAAKRAKEIIYQLNEDHNELWPDMMCPGMENYYGDDIDATTI